MFEGLVTYSKKGQKDHLWICYSLYYKTYVRDQDYYSTVIYELYGMSRITTGLLYSIFGLRVPDDGTVTFYREIKFKMGFDVVHCCYYDKIYLQ